jgi:hypothetical protein
MVDVTVCVDDCGYRLFRPVLEIEFHCRLGRMGGRSRVNHDQTRIAFNDSQVGDIEAAHLV